MFGSARFLVQQEEEHFLIAVSNLKILTGGNIES